jgi:peptidoglycan-associated lipoprotein
MEEDRQMKSSKRLATGTLALAIAAGGCATVGQDEFNAEVAAIRAEIAEGDERVTNGLARRIDGLDERTAALEAQMSDLEGALRSLESEFDVTVERLEASLMFSTPIHFGFDRADVTAEHTPLLERFASVVNGHYPNALVTVEGFTDSAGSEAYNLALGQRRADAVRSWLVEEGSLVADLVRAVSYGEDTSRLVREGASGPGAAGEANRRVVFVVEHVQPARALISESQEGSSGS